MTHPIPILSDPYELFEQWFGEAQKLGLKYPNAMTVATADADGHPHCRVVLLKGYDSRGFVFYTNFNGAKGRQILAHPKVSLCFYWEGCDRQIRVAGIARPVSEEEADEYFATRPRLSRIGAWASNQSEEIESRHVLEAKLHHYEKEFEGKEVPRPPHWSGFRVSPHTIEFWREGDYRLHDRLVYYRKGAGWETRWLSP